MSQTSTPGRLSPTSVVHFCKPSMVISQSRPSNISREVGWNIPHTDNAAWISFTSSRTVATKCGWRCDCCTLMFNTLCCGELYNECIFEELFGSSGMMRGFGVCEKVRICAREWGGDLERNGCCAVDGASGTKYNDLNRSLVVSL